MHAGVMTSRHDGFHALLDSLITDHLDKPGVSEPDRSATARLTTFAVEGLLSHLTSGTETRAILDLVLPRQQRVT